MSSQKEIPKLHSRLIDAIHIGDATVVEELLQGGADPNGSFDEDEDDTSRQYLPLHEATGCEDAELVRLLVKHGADVWKAASTGATALHDASLCGNHAATKFLLEQGVEVDVQDKTGRTALHEAAEHGQEAAIRLLLESGASAAARAEGGATPVDLAIHHGHFRLFQLLLESGGNFDRKGRGYTTAWNKAVWTRNRPLAGLINIKKAIFQNIQDRSKPLETLILSIEKSIVGGQGTGPQVCSQCVDFHRRPPSLWERGYAKEIPAIEDAYYCHLAYYEVESSAKQGCVFCRMILDSLRTPGAIDEEIKGQRSTGYHDGRNEYDFPFQSLDIREVQLAYKAYSKRYLRAPTRHLWSDYLDKIEVKCGNKSGYIRVASLDGITIPMSLTTVHTRG